MLKHIMLSLSLLTIVNSAFGSEKPITQTTMIHFKHNDSRQFATFILGNLLPFLKSGSAEDITPGSIVIDGQKVHTITADPSTWVTTERLLSQIGRNKSTSIKIIFDGPLK